MSELEKDIRLHVENKMTEYASRMPDSFYEDIKADVILTSAYEDEGYYSEGDISLAFQRVILDKFGIEY